MVNSHQKTGIPLPDGLSYQEIMKNDMYDNFITFKCLDCGKTEELEEDFIIAFLEHYPDQDYPSIFVITVTEMLYH